MGPRDHRQVEADQRRQHRREDEDVGDEHAREEGVGPGEGAVPDQRREVRAHDRYRQRRRVADREPHAGEEVVQEGVAEVALEHRDDQHRQADVVVDVPRLAKRAREEDPQEVEDDRADEDVRRPVVRLPDEKPGAHAEREVEDGGVRLAHLLAVERRV